MNKHPEGIEKKFIKSESSKNRVHKNRPIDVHRPIMLITDYFSDIFFLLILVERS